MKNIKLFLILQIVIKMKWFKTIRTLQKMSKHMKRKSELRKHMDKYLEEKYKIKDEKEFLAFLQTNPDEIKNIVIYYDSIKSKY